MNDSNFFIPKGMVSVIIPAYNSIQWIDRAIQSVQNQTYKNIEIIVVDDGSTDGTYDYLKKFYPDIIVVKKANGGIASARNFGVYFSKGELLAFLDSDDLMAPGKIETQLEAVRGIPDWGLCGTDTWTFLAGEAIDPDICKPLQKNKCKISILSQDTLIEHNQIITSSVLIRREVFFKANRFDENLRRVEDYDLWLRIAEHWKIVLVKAKLLWYQITPGSLSDDIVAMRWDELKVLSKWQKIRPEIVLPVLRKHSMSLTRKLLRSGKINQAKKIFWGPYSGKRMNWLSKIQFFLLGYSCKLHALFFTAGRGDGN